MSESAEEGGESTTLRLKTCLRLESQHEPAADTRLDRQTFSSSVTQFLHIKLVYMNNMHFQSFSIHLFSVKKARTLRGPNKVVFTPLDQLLFVSESICSVSWGLCYLT